MRLAPAPWTYPWSAPLHWDKVIFQILLKVSVCWILSLGAINQKSLKKIRWALVLRKYQRQKQGFFVVVVFFFVCLVFLRNKSVRSRCVCVSRKKDLAGTSLCEIKGCSPRAELDLGTWPRQCSLSLGRTACRGLQLNCAWCSPSDEVMNAMNVALSIDGRWPFKYLHLLRHWRLWVRPLGDENVHLGTLRSQTAACFVQPGVLLCLHTWLCTTQK